jgi:putative heme-binding domain-containing protein
VYPRADIEYGARIYTAQCSACHGTTGDAIAAVDLGAGRFQRVRSDADLRAVVTTGIAGTAMPPFTFTAAEMAGVVAYVRNMRNFGSVAAPAGDMDRGRVIFEGRGACMTCHRVSGRGSRVAPDLTDIGSLRTAAVIEHALLDPGGSLLPVNRSVRAVKRNGQVITGRRLNEDTYTVQLIDDQERLVSLTKTDLQQYSIVTASRMPPYMDVFSRQDVADVVAYLLSLRGPK